MLPWIARIARTWLPIALAVTLLCGLMYVVGQQEMRVNLNDPQVQLARSAAAAIDAGGSAASVVPSGSVDVATSLAPFVIVYGADDRALAGSGLLSGSLPVPPRGVLATARSASENRVTWQPRSGVRIASVSVGTRSGAVVLAGRNMSEIESRISALGRLVAAGWLATLGLTLLLVAAIEWVARRRELAA